MSDMIWQDPPPKRARGGGPGKTYRFVEALKKRPNEWALYASGRYSFCESLRRYSGVESAQRKTPDGQIETYARWVGET